MLNLTFRLLHEHIQTHPFLLEAILYPRVSAWKASLL